MERNGGIMRDNGWRNTNMSGIGPSFILLYSLIVLLLTWNQFFMIFLFSFFFSIFFWKQLVCLQQVFILVACPRRLKRGFHLDIFLFLFFPFVLDTIGPPPEVFNLIMGLRCLMEAFTSVLIFHFFFLTDLLREELKLVPPPSLFYWYHQWTLALTMVSCKYSLCAH